MTPQQILAEAVAKVKAKKATKTPQEILPDVVAKAKAAKAAKNSDTELGK
jgi:hypothetical protein